MTSTTSHAIRVRVAGMLLRDGKMLLISHKKDGKEYWLVPGGGVDFGESVHAALVREMREELSVEVIPGELMFSADSIDREGSRHILNLFFLCEYVKGEFLLGDDDRLSGFGFFTAGEIRGLKMYPPCNEMVASVLEGKKVTTYIGELWEN